MLIYTIETPPLAAFSYIVVDNNSRRCVVVDPVRNVVPILQQLCYHQLQVEVILETHVHADYVSGALELKHHLQGYPKIYCSKAGGPEWLPSYADVPVEDGSIIEMGQVLLKACHTPGHTPEHMSWEVFDLTHSRNTPCLAFTGDFLFAGSVGRPDLLGAKAAEELTKALHHSLFVTIASWPDFLALYPAHGAGSLCGKAMSGRLPTTLGYERLTNPAFQLDTYEKWSSSLLADMSSPPAAFRHIKELNRRGPRLYGDLPLEKKLWTTEDLLKEEVNNLFIVDLRSPDRFAAGHLPNAVNIPWSPSFCTWLGMVAPYDRPLLLLLDGGIPFDVVATHVALVGFEKIAGYYQMSASSLPDEIMIPWITAEELHRREDIEILDVRTPSEWHAGHIARAHHLELSKLHDHLDSLPCREPIAVICGSGMRASVAASLLQRAGTHTLYNVRGGMQAWHKAALPTIQ